MVTKTKNNKEFKVTDNMVKTIAKICCCVLIVALTVNFFGIDKIGTPDEVGLQIIDTSYSMVVKQEQIQPLVYAPGIKKEAYSDATKLSKAMSSNNFVVEEQLTDTGVPIELLEESEFTLDGSKMWIRTTKCNVRQAPDVESEAIGSLIYSEKITRISYGATWSKIRLSDGTEGFVLSQFLSSDEILPPTPTPTPTPTPKPKAPAQTTTTTTTTNTDTSSGSSFTETSASMTVYASCSMNLRTGPGTDYGLVRVLNTGDEITVVATTSNGWYKTAKGNYVLGSLCTTTKPEVSTGSGGGGGGSNPLADYCLQYVGCSYVYAGSSPSGFDCSGFVMYVYANYYGISLPHSADSISKYGTAISSSEMLPGDVVCNDHNGDGYMDHVSIYIGDGYIVHASTSTTGVIKSNFADVRDVATIRRIA